MNAYDIGDLVELKGTFRRTLDNAVTDPTMVVLKVKKSDATLITYIYGMDAALVKDSQGVYHCDIEPDVPGRWTFQWKGTGAVKTMEESHFQVRTPEIS